MNLARQRQAVAGRPHGTGAQTKGASQGTAKINAAVGKTLEKHSEEIAESLLKSMRGGNVSCAKLLFALAEGQIDCEDEVVMKRLCSLAEKLAAEQPWTGPVDEAETESSFELQEAEG